MELKDWNPILKSAYAEILKDTFRQSHNSKIKERDRIIRNYKPSIYEHLKPQRNGQCPCGSGKKYKNCCINKKGKIRNGRN